MIYQNDTQHNSNNFQIKRLEIVRVMLNRFSAVTIRATTLLSRVVDMVFQLHSLVVQQEVTSSVGFSPCRWFTSYTHVD